jgi:hypothetical protein
MNKEKWSALHHNIYASIKIIDDKILKEEKELEKINLEYKNKIKILERQIHFLQSRCQHIDDGGMFVDSCSVCGWSDSYGDC